EQVARRGNAGIVRIPREHAAIVAPLRPREPGGAVLEADVGTHAAIQASGQPRASPEGGAYRRLGRVGAHLEILTFPLAEPVLNDLRQASSRELEGRAR